jgi:hypothetical protein
MNRIFVLALALALLTLPASLYAQDDASQSTAAAEAGMSSNLSSEMSGQEEAARSESNIADEETAGNSGSQMTAVEQADEE